MVRRTYRWSVQNGFACFIASLFFLWLIDCDHDDDARVMHPKEVVTWQATNSLTGWLVVKPSFTLEEQNQNPHLVGTIKAFTMDHQRYSSPWAARQKLLRTLVVAACFACSLGAAVFSMWHQEYAIASRSVLEKASIKSSSDQGALLGSSSSLRQLDSSSGLIMYHNENCSGSKATLQYLQAHGIHPKLVLYMKKDPLSERQIRTLMKQMGVSSAAEMVRPQDAQRKAHLDLSAASEQEIIHALVEYPAILQRPILVKGDKAIRGSPPEKVMELLQ